MLETELCLLWLLGDGVGDGVVFVVVDKRWCWRRSCVCCGCQETVLEVELCLLWLIRDGVGDRVVFVVVDKRRCWRRSCVCCGC